MKKYRAAFWTVRVVILLGVMLWLVCAVFHPWEPRYQGKTVSDWTSDYCDNRWDPDTEDYNVAQQERDREAIRHIGTNALPLAMELCRAHDSAFKQQLLKWANKEEVLCGFQLDSAMKAHIRSWQLFTILGPIAKPAIPALVHLLQDKDRQVVLTASIDLTSIGADAIPSLTVALTDPNAQVRGRAADILGKLQNTNPSATPGPSQ